MPITIGEIESTVDVEAAGEGGGGGSTAGGGTAPSPQAQQRWAELARRSEELAARTAAWRFDD